jgi:peptidoglycan biosynthesis protein MviN/MurJ (putative lipid II flippase)
LFGAGRFDAESERVTTESFLAYVVFLPLTAPAAVIARSVYALGMLRLLVAQGVVVLLAKIIVGLLLRDSYEHVGVAAAGGLATMIGAAVVLIAAVRAARRIGRRPGSENGFVAGLQS